MGRPNIEAIIPLRFSGTGDEMFRFIRNMESEIFKALALPPAALYSRQDIDSTIREIERATTKAELDHPWEYLGSDR